jgi:release factor glutamine methyltransferase
VPTSTVAALLDAAAARLGTALGLDRREARLETKTLAAFAWRVASAWLIAHDRDAVETDRVTRFEALLARRLAGEPVAYITGVREFYGRPFRVTPAVLIPRPDTELLVEQALARLPPEAPCAVLDLGTGSGCIAVTLALERPNARVSAVDRAADALAIARENAARLGAAVEWLAGDWFGALDGRRFDIIVGNPPYVAANDPHLARGDVRFEPAGALASGADGLDDLRHLITHAPRHLQAGGSLLLEHGYDQAEAVRACLAAHAYTDIASWTDLAGIARVSGGKLSE